MSESMPPCPDADGCRTSPLCPLTRVKAGTDVRIKQLSGPPAVSQRLREMGLCEEQQVKLVSHHTTIICQVCNARLGLSSRLAETILVELLPVLPKTA